VGNVIPILGVKPKQGDSFSLLLSKTGLCSSISFKRSLRELSIDMAVPDVSDAPLCFVLGNPLTDAMWVAYHRCLRTVLVLGLLGDKKFVVKVR